MNKAAVDDLVREHAPVCDLVVNEPMKNHTTLRIGGCADIYAVPDDLASLKKLLLALREENIPVMPLGGGSNLLVVDDGIEGAVISTSSLNNIEIVKEDSGSVLVAVQAGITLGRLVSISREKGYKGIEGLAGIPGSLGGAICGNAGSFGFEIGNVIESVSLMDGNGKILSIGKKEIKFGYRTSDIPEGRVLISANMIFQKDDAHQIAKRINVFLKEKMSRQPISQFSAGCVFKNQGEVHAGRLIEEAGCKGMRRGDIEVSSIHANFFINRGNGKASDFLALMEDVRGRVMKSSGVDLKPEIRIVGKRDNG